MFDATFSAGLLHLPEQKAGGMTSFDPRPKATEKWVKGLPRADVGETARLVYKALHELNRTVVSDADRFQIAEQLREPVEFLSMSLKKHYIGLPFPLPRKKSKVAMLARELNAEMAISYKIIIENRLAGNSRRLEQRMLTAAIYRTIFYLGQVLQRCYQIYVPSPVNLWRELHGLYLFAHASNIHNIMVKDPMAANGRGGTIMEIYKQVVLLALSGPYRMRQTEIETLSVLLGQWSAYTQINEIVDPDQQTGMCSLNLNSDDPPGYLTLCGDKNISYCRVLDTSQLIAVLGDFITDGMPVQLEGALGKTNRISVDVLRRLALTWGGMAKRNFSRTTKNTRILVTIGLPAIHHFISDAHKAPSQLTEAPAQDQKTNVPAAAANETPLALDLVPIDDGRNGTHAGQFGERRPAQSKRSQPHARRKDEWNPLYKIDTPLYEAPPGTNHAQIIAAESAPKQPKYNVHICTGLNESAGGFCFLWIPANDVEVPNLNALVGELIGMQELDEENKSRWSVGVVRWMKSRDGQQIELGVQRLAPYALAAGISKDRNKNVASFFNSLVLPELLSDNQPVTVVVPNTYDVGDTLLMDLEGERKSIRLSKEIETTGSFTHFLYKEQKKAAATKEMRADEDKEGFDNLWSSL